MPRTAKRKQAQSDTAAERRHVRELVDSMLVPNPEQLRTNYEMQMQSGKVSPGSCLAKAMDLRLSCSNWREEAGRDECQRGIESLARLRFWQGWIEETGNAAHDWCGIVSDVCASREEPCAARL